MMYDPLDSSKINAAGDRQTTSFPAREAEARARMLHYQARHEIEKVYLTDAQRVLVNEEVKNAVQENRRIIADTRDRNANAVLRELAQAEARGSSAWHSKYPEASRERHWTPVVSGALEAIGSGVGSATGLRRLTEPAQGLRRPGVRW